MGMQIAEILGIMDVRIPTSFEHSKWNSFEVVAIWNLQNSGILGKSCCLIMAITLALLGLET
jgi:hypothetical protein